MSNQSKLAAWQSPAPIIVAAETVAVEAPKVTKIAEALKVAPVVEEPVEAKKLPIQDVTEHELDGIVVKPLSKKLKIAE